MIRKSPSIIAVLPAVLLGSTVVILAGALDLNNAVVVTPANLAGPEKKAVAMLLDEVERRTQIRWPTASTWPAPGRPIIAVGRSSALKEFAGKLPALSASQDRPAAEGYRIRIQNDPNAQILSISGNDSRGVLFGIGRLLRELRMTNGHVDIDDHFSVTTAPKYPLRGHQLGYRPKTHSYDAWDLPVWE